MFGPAPQQFGFSAVVGNGSHALPHCTTTWSVNGPEHTGHFVQPHVAAHCGGDIYSRRKPLFSSFGEHTAVCGSSVRQAVARPRHRQSVCIHNIHVAATCRPSVLGSATMRGHMWLNKVASVLGPNGCFLPSCSASFGMRASWLISSFCHSLGVIQNLIRYL